MDKFKHLDDTVFPDISTVNPYKYKNNIDYSEYEGITAEIRLLNVPWDSQYDNVVEFYSKEDRKKYIEQKTEHVFYFETNQILQNNGTIKLPIPFNVAKLYNYIAIHLPDSIPVEYGKAAQIQDIFYFVLDVQRDSPSTSTLFISEDIWQTWIDDMQISYMNLRRGHAPLAFAPSPTEYLSDPLHSCDYLSEPEPDIILYNKADKIKAISNYIFNNNSMYVVISMTVDLEQSEGTKSTDSMVFPKQSYSTTTGTADFLYYAIPIANFATFASGIESTSPWLMEAIKSIYYISSSLLTIPSTSFTKFGVSIYKVGQNLGSKHELMRKLTVDDFGYDSKYRNITKLYTSPFAVIEVDDGSGRNVTINIEDIDDPGKLEVYAGIDLLGSATIEAHIVGICGRTDNIIEFGNAGIINKFNATASWERYAYSFDVPQLAIFASEAEVASWRRYWSNKQAAVSYNAAETQAKLGADYAKQNAIDEQTVLNYSQSAVEKRYSIDKERAEFNNNNILQITAKQSRVSQSVSDFLTFQTKTQLQTQRTLSTIPSILGGTASIGYASASATPQASALGGISQIAFSTIDGIAGVYFDEVNSKYAQRLQDINFSVNYLDLEEHRWPWQDDDNFFYEEWDEAYRAMPFIQGTDLINLNPDSLEVKKNWYQIQNVILTMSENVTSSVLSYKNQTALKSGANVYKVNNSYSDVEDTGITLYGTSNRAKDLAYSNAAASKAVSQSSVSTGNADAALNPPKQFGEFAGSTQKPIGLFSYLRRQSDASIASAGDIMLRFGYSLNRAWNASKLQVMKNFTYWQCNEIWITSTRINEVATESIKNIFRKGCTVWNNPDKIEAVSLYDNWSE